LIGNGVDKNRLQSKAEELNLNNVHFHSSVPKSIIPLILNQADLLIHSFAPLDVFKYGVSPNKIFDYMASGKPIIMIAKTTNKIIEEANAGLVIEPGNVEALIQGIKSIKNMSIAERKKLGENGKLYVAKYHDIKILANKLEQILQ
jgi:glycosyltransferase involved in cell wall biosynthesis